jgi:sugar/nucleoside kinase (ribokinase family)
MDANLVAVGDNVVDRYIDRGVMYPGGNAVNVAVHARRCGARSAYVGAVGTDRAGRAVLDALVAEGIDTSQVRVLDGPNAYAVVQVVEGNRVFGHADVGVSQFTLSDADLAVVAAADIVHTGECSLMEDQLADLALAARRLSFDFSERPWSYVEKYARHAQVAIRSCPGATAEEGAAEAKRLQGLGPAVVAVTLGAEGAVLLGHRAFAYARPEPAPVVDTLGAGDAFIARFLLGLTAGEDLRQLAQAATAYATSTCASFGAFGYETAIEATTTTPLDPNQQGAFRS